VRECLFVRICVCVYVSMCVFLCVLLVWLSFRVSV
jgi:hypothetical protein